MVPWAAKGGASGQAAVGEPRVSSPQAEWSTRVRASAGVTSMSVSGDAVKCAAGLLAQVSAKADLAVKIAPHLVERATVVGGRVVQDAPVPRAADPLLKVSEVKCSPVAHLAMSSAPSYFLPTDVMRRWRRWPRGVRGTRWRKTSCRRGARRR